MINTMASKIGKFLAGPVASSKYYKDRFNKEEIEQIITFNMISNIKQGIWMILLIISTYIILLMGIDIRLNTLIIFIIIMVFRKKFGGYHADSEIICLMVSTIFPLVLSYIAMKFDLNIYMIVIIYIFSYITALKKRVVDHPNRRFEKDNKVLNLDMKQNLFKSGMRLLAAITIVQLVMYNIKAFTNISDSLALGTFISFINLYFGK